MMYGEESAARHLAEEQAALRRVAGLVRRDVPQAELFAAVAEEVGRLLEADAASLLRYDAERNVGVVMAWWARRGQMCPPLGSLGPMAGGVTEAVARTRRPMRIDWTGRAGALASYTRDQLRIRSSLGSPVVVKDRVWGALLVHSVGLDPPPYAESRLSSFCELVATAISHAESEAQVRRLADEQAALRRVATLVARQPSPDEVFATVVAEVGGLLGVEKTRLVRFERDGSGTLLNVWPPGGPIAVGTRVDISGGDNVSSRILHTGRSARFDEYLLATGGYAEFGQRDGVRAAAGSPIVVGGRLWGALMASSSTPFSLPPDIEARIERFTALVATAISNVEAHTALAESRERIVLAADQARRRFERDLHDGAQQRIVSLALELRLAADEAPDALRGRLGRVGKGLDAVLDELRELSSGLHPAVLSEGGLRPALRALARRSAVPVRLRADIDGRFDEPVEVAAYFVVSEALANVAKHARASTAEVIASADAGRLRITVRDDGAGGAVPGTGSGLVGLKDRVEALGGTMEIDSPPGRGTEIHAELPLAVRCPDSLID